MARVELLARVLGTVQCTMCKMRETRSPLHIAMELTGYLKAIAILVRFENPDASRPWAEGKAEVLSQRHAEGLALELRGLCVYCAHPMEKERAAAFRAAGGQVLREGVPNA